MEQSLHRNQIAPLPAREPDPTAAAALASPVRHLRVPCKSVGLFQSYPSPQTLLWVTCLTHLPETEPACGTEPQNPSGAAQPELLENLTFRAAGAERGWSARCVGSDPARARGLGVSRWVPRVSCRAQPAPSGAPGLTGPLSSQPGRQQCLRQDPGPGRGSFVPLSRGPYSRLGLLQPRHRVPLAVFSRRRSLEGSDARAAGGRRGQPGRCPARGMPK